MEIIQGQFSGEAARGFLNTLRAVAKDCREDPQFRARLDASPRDALVDKGLELPPTSEIRVFANTEDVFHLVLPPDPNVMMSDDSLVGISGGSPPPQRLALSTVSTIPSTVSTGSTVSP